MAARFKDPFEGIDTGASGASMGGRTVSAPSTPRSRMSQSIRSRTIKKSEPKKKQRSGIREALKAAARK